MKVEMPSIDFSFSMKCVKTVLLVLICFMFHDESYGMHSGPELDVSAVSSVPEPQSRSVADRIRFAYDLDFEMNFDNREFSYSDIFPSYTIIGARMTPALGVSVDQRNGTRHRLMAGIDVMKDFGRSETVKNADTLYSGTSGNLDLFGEILIYYNLRSRIGKTDFSLTAGIFPRRFALGEYSPAFISDSFRWYDNNLEGLLLQFRRPASYFEVGCDWLGMAGKESRERFIIFSSGKGRMGRIITLGYSGYMYHFAGSTAAPGVVDNILLNPYVDFDFSGLVPLQMLHVSAGWLQALQNDRKLVHEYVAPGGVELVAGIGKWNAGITNRFYYGRNLMPYYNTVGTGGDIYAADLYFGDPFYRLRDMDGWHCYDRLEVFYAPRLSDYVDLKVAAVLHFSGGYAGWQQMVTVHFNLQELLSHLKER